MSIGAIPRSLLVVAFAISSVGCFGKKLSSPFDAMENAPITVLRLQNYEQPQAQTGAAAPLQLPPQIQQWMQMGAQLLPPGLLPPNLLPGATQTPPAANVARFHGFPILQTAQVTDTKTREEILNIFGHESSFESPKTTCLYAEFGVAISQINAPPAEILVSLSCSQVQAFQMAWPYSKNGLTADTQTRIIAIMNKAFGAGS